MINYLYENDRHQDALELAKRCSCHDNSKLDNDEINNFIQLPREFCKGKKYNNYLTPDKKKLLEVHWSKNRHHPEFFTDYHMMNDIDIMEMCCDWYARSLQFETKFIDFVINRQKERFQFDDDFFDKVMFYCDILDKK
jgi:hypothetical protein